MKTSLRTDAREAFIERCATDVQRWSQSVDTLVRAFRSRDRTPPVLRERVEAMRNKRDTVETKVEALARHRTQGWARAKLDFEDAKRELRDSWRTVISVLDRESLFP